MSSEHKNLEEYIYIYESNDQTTYHRKEVFKNQHIYYCYL